MSRRETKDDGAGRRAVPRHIRIGSAAACGADKRTEGGYMMWFVEHRVSVTCKRCLASLAKRDGAFRRKCRHHFAAARREAIGRIGLDRYDELGVSAQKARAARAIAAEEGRS